MSTPPTRNLQQRLSDEEFKVVLTTYEGLSADERLYAPDNGRGKEQANYVRVSHNGRTLFFFGKPRTACSAAI